MKKLMWIGLPVLIISFIAANAFTHPDPPKPGDKAIKEVFAFAEGGYRLGVVLSDINRHLRDDLKIESGVLVAEVLEDSPAEKAGLKEGDIIVKVDGNPVTDEKEIRRILRDMEEAKSLNLEIYRDGKSMTIPVQPEKRSVKWMGAWGGRYIGVELQDLNSDLAPYFQVDAGSGVLVARVVPESPAEKAGLKSGDVITQFNGEKVSSAEVLRSKLNDTEEETVSITVIRKGKEQKFTVSPEKNSMRGFRHLRALPELAEIPEIPDLPEVPEMRHSMRDLEREMEQLREELKKLKMEDLQAIKEEVQKQVEEVRKQLKELRESD